MYRVLFQEENTDDTSKGHFIDVQAADQMQAVWQAAQQIQPGMILVAVIPLSQEVTS